MPPKTPTDKAAAESAHQAEHRIESHQPSLGEAMSELAVNRDPATGQSRDATIASTSSTNPGTATGGLMDYWQARLVLSQQQTRLIAADQRFQEFTSTNSWAKEPSISDPESLASLERLYKPLNISQRVMDEVRQALIRSGNTEEVRIREARDFPGFNPEATEFKPS